VKQLPNLMRRAPKIFYVLAFLFAAFSFALSYWEIVAHQNAFATELDDISRVAVFKALYQALLEAVYIVASGALIHIAILIWDKMSEKSEAAE